MNQPSASLAEFIDRFDVQELLLFSPHQVWFEIARCCKHRKVNGLYNRSKLQPALDLTPEPCGTMPLLGRVNAADSMPKPRERAHSHRRCLADAYLSEEENPQAPSRRAQVQRTSVAACMLKTRFGVTPTGAFW